MECSELAIPAPLHSTKASSIAHDVSRPIQKSSVDTGVLSFECLCPRGCSGVVRRGEEGKKNSTIQHNKANIALRDVVKKTAKLCEKPPLQRLQGARDRTRRSNREVRHEVALRPRLEGSTIVIVRQTARVPLQGKATLPRWRDHEGL